MEGACNGTPIAAGDRSTLRITSPVSRRLGIEKECLASIPHSQKEIVPIVGSTPTKTNPNCSTGSSQTANIGNGDYVAGVDNGINASQQSAIYNMISKFFGLSIRNNGGKFESNFNGDSSTRLRSFSSTERQPEEDTDEVLADLEETLRLVLDRLLQMVEVPFIENILEYLSSCENKIEDYQHLFTTSGSLSSLSLSGSDDSLNSNSSSLSSNSSPSLKKVANSNFEFNRTVFPCLQFHPHISSLVPKSKQLAVDQKQSLANLVLTNCREWSLIPFKLTELCCAVDIFVASETNHFFHDVSKVVDAVFLFATLLHSDVRQRLHNVVMFLRHIVDHEPEMFLTNDKNLLIDAFALCFIPDRDCSHLLKVMLNQANQVFAHWSNYNMLMLSGLHKKLERSTFCKRISVQQFVEQKRENTTDELMALLDFVLGEKSTLTARQKDKLMNAVKSKHPEVYGLYLSLKLPESCG